MIARSRRVAGEAGALLVVVALAAVLSRPSSTSMRPLLEEDEQREGPSGALAALDLWSAARAYPEGVIPDVGHAAAFREAQLLRGGGLSIDDTIDPWESMGPANIGGRTLALAVRPDDPDVLFAGSASGGLWKSVTGGVGAAAWDRVETGFPVSAVGAIALDPSDPDVMYVGTGEVYAYQQSIGGEAIRTTRGSYGIGILKSTDGGSTWAMSLDWSLAQTRGVQCLAVHPIVPGRLFAGTSEGVYRSTDAGATWTDVHPVLMVTDLRIHPTDPNIVYAACGNFGSAGVGLYRSTNGGDTWGRLGGGLLASWTGKAHLAVAPTAPNVVLASLANVDFGRGLWRSTDMGLTWMQINGVDFPSYQGWYSHWVLVDPANANRVFTGGIEIWRSTNGGVNLSQRSVWTQVFIDAAPPPEGPIGGPQYAHADHHAALWHPTEPNTIFFASDGGVFKTTDGGDTFQSLIGGYVTAQFYNGFSNSRSNPNLAIGGCQDNFTNLWQGGSAWRRLIGGDGGWAAIDPTDDGIMFGTYQYLGTLRSFDGMLNYGLVTPPSTGGETTCFIAPLVMSPSTPAILYGGRARVYKTTNYGTSWITTNGGAALDGTNPVLSMTISSTSSDSVWAGTAPVASPARVFRTTNGGGSWVDVTGFLPDRYPMDVTVDPVDSRNVYVVFSGFGTSHLFGSTDAGDTWEDLGAGLPDVPTSAVEVDPSYPEVLYVGNDLGVWMSPDRGLTWQPFSNGMPTALVNDLKVFAPTRKLRAATHGNGVWQRDLFDPSLVGVAEVASTSRSSLTVRPNPVHGVARVGFALSREGRVRLALYDVAGRRVRALLDGTRAAGRHEVDLDPSGLAPGVYFARLEAASRAEVARVVYVR